MASRFIYPCGCATCGDIEYLCKEHEEEAVLTYVVKDSGKRQEFAGGMLRDTQEGKLDIWRVFVGPLVERLAAHLTKGAAKYPDVTPGVPNWTLAAGEEEMVRFKQSAARHFWQWYHGVEDEDHFAATTFNMNGFEEVKRRLRG